MVDAYLAQAMRCRTINEFNRLHITLENVLPPADIGEIIRGVRARLSSMPEPVAHWFAMWESRFARVGGPLQRYVRRQVVPGMVAYAAPGSDDERSSRTLVVAFAGDANRLMMPIALFLQHCPSDRYEFALLFDGTGGFFLRGVEGLGTSLPQAIDGIAAHLRPSTYRRTMTFGCSGGGLAAVWSGIALGVDRVVSVGGVTPSMIFDRVRRERLGDETFEKLLATHRGPLPEIVLTSGEHNERDRGKAVEMGAILPVKHVIVPGSADHNMLHDAWQLGTLQSLLDRVLGEGDPLAA